MFGLGLWEIVMIAVVAVVLIRPHDLPRILRRLGRAYGMLFRLKESALQTARELESEINRLERAPAPGAEGGPAAEASGNGDGTGDRPGEAGSSESGGLVDEAAPLYGRLRQEDGEDGARLKELKETEGKGKAAARRAREAKPKLDDQGGTGAL